MAQTKLNAVDLLKAGSVQRTHLDTTTSGSAVIAKVLASTGLGISSTGANVGTGDVTLSVNGELPNVASAIGSLTFGVNPGTLYYSTTNQCILQMTGGGSVWTGLTVAQAFIAVVIAALTNGDSATVDCGSIDDGGSQTDLGTLAGNAIMQLDLGTVP